MKAPAVTPREERRLQGIVLILAAISCFTMIDSSAKWLVRSLPPLEVVFIRYLGHLLIVSAYGFSLYGLSLMKTQALGGEVWRAVVLLASTVLNFLAVQYLPLATTAAITFTSPLWVCALSIPLLGERVGPRRWAAIVVGFLGVLVVVRPGMAGFHWATLLSISAALSVSLYVIETRRLAGVDAIITQQFYGAVFATILICPFALFNWVWPSSPLEWAVFLSIGFWGWLGHLLLTMAYRLAPATTLAPFTYMQLIPMTIAGYVFFGDQPDLWVFIGGAIVVSSGLYVWYRERHLGTQASQSD